MEQNLKPILDDADIEAYVRAFIACGIIKAPTSIVDLEISMAANRIVDLRVQNQTKRNDDNSDRPVFSFHD
jgi:hypothetical protein